MKVGDLVKTVQLRRSRHRDKCGLLVAQVQDRLAMHNKVFKVLWQNGTIGNNIWDYDLEVISESR